MKILLMLGASALSLGACSYEPTPLPVVTAQLAPLSSSTSSPTTYRDPLAGYTYRSPTGPGDWRSLNQVQSEGN